VFHPSQRAREIARSPKTPHLGKTFIHEMIALSIQHNRLQIPGHGMSRIQLKRLPNEILRSLPIVLYKRLRPFDESIKQNAPSNRVRFIKLMSLAQELNAFGELSLRT
jgi:hypothetical protein